MKVDLEKISSAKTRQIVRDAVAVARDLDAAGHIPEAETANATTIAPTWPDIVAPPMYPDHPHPDWEDLALPDFRTIMDAARSVGYSIGLHGSMRRDVDLIAVPWTEEAGSPDDLIEAVCRATGASIHGSIAPKPHGRMAVILVIDGWVKHIDLSIIRSFEEIE